VFAGKKRMGQRGQRERVSLYFSTSCLFSCVRIGYSIFFFFGDWSLRTGLPPPLEWNSILPLVTAVLITPKGAQHQAVVVYE